MSKRARTINAAEEPDYIEIKVTIPSMPAPDVVIASSGKGFRPRCAVHPVRFKRSGEHKFWRLWSNFQEYMLCREGETEPYMDFEAPVDQLGTLRFTAIPWDAKYKRQQLHLSLLHYSHQKKLADAKRAEAEAEVIKQQKACEVIDERVAAIQAKIDELAQE